MSRRKYPILFPAVGVTHFQCVGTVTRFRLLPPGTLFLMGEDEDIVYQKSGALEIALRYPASDARLCCSAELNDDPWCEPMEAVP